MLMINIKGLLLMKKKTLSTTKCFHLKLQILIFYGKYGTLYEYLNHLLGSGVDKKFFFEDLSKGLKLEKVYAKNDINNTE